MSEFPPVVYVDIKQALSSIIPGRRQQRWHWVAKSAGNQRVLARSSERYTNRGDALYAVALLFSSASTVYLREAEHGNQLLRQAAPDAD